ncbi:MAG: 23S rRNA (adenine(2503)-C(2))-methyltransferase RlmN [Pseudomonadota bacterium]
MTQPRTNFYACDRASLEAAFVAAGFDAYRARQVMKWVYHHDLTDFAAMTNLSKAQRAWLATTYDFRLPEVAACQTSTDGTIKWGMRLPSGELVETVMIPEGKRRTLCVSSQVGCMLDCTFCATGKQGFNGNLDAGQIFSQTILANRELKARGDSGVTNVVLMGMGEPLLNFDAVITATSLMCDDLALGLAKRRVTISTAGVVPQIHRLADTTDVALAISLHAPTNAQRDSLVPLNKKYPIEDLMAACQRYVDVLGERRSITVEYTLIRGVNDALLDAKRLAKLLRPLRCKINLIPFNPFPGSGFERPSATAVRDFQTYLLNHGHSAMLRTTRGDDIDAACGQLVGRVEDRTRRQERYRARLAAEAVEHAESVSRVNTVELR